MHPIFEQTLKKPNGRWDKQAMTFFLFVILSVASGISLIVASLVFGVKDINVAYDVFTTFITTMLILAGGNIGNKWVDYTKAKNANYDPYGNTYNSGTIINNKQEETIG